MSAFVFPLYKNTTPDGPEFLCMPLENGTRQLLVFSGNNAVETVQRAKDWVNKEFDTPERRERTKRAAEARKAQRKPKATDIAPAGQKPVTAFANAGE